MRDAVRVALLARPGAGADRLREALGAAGANLVLDADPTTLDPATLAAAGAESVVVLLDAAVEDALERLDPVLHDPAIDVLYEESEVAASREGWDAARWTRHLSAKLMRHGDVLPPGREADAPVAPPARAEPAPAESAPIELAPIEPALPEPAPPRQSPPPSMFDPVAAEFDPVAAESEPVDAAPEQPAPATGPERKPAPEPDWSGLTLSLEGDEPATTPESPAAPADTPLTLSLDDGAGPAVEPPAPAQASTTPQGAAARPAPAARSDALRDFRRDLANIEQRIASMGLVEQEAPDAKAGTAAAPVAPEPTAGLSPDTLPEPGQEPAAPAAEPPGAAIAGPAGAVLVFAGIGGPDAVRQFLGALPEAFPRPILIHQRLDGGRHDRLVQQMARATTLPVHLAAEDEAAAPGHVYILPPGLRLAAGDSGLRFAAGDDPMAALPAAGSAVLMFSGSDTAMVDAAMGHAQAGALVAGQSPEDCYDAAAADALVARGAESGQPAELARRLAERWAA